MTLESDSSPRTPPSLPCPAPLFLAAVLVGACTSSDTKTTPEDTGPTVADTGSSSSDAGDALEEATELEFDSDGVASAWDAIDPAEDRDFFYIQPDAGSVVLVYTAAYGETGQSGEPDTVIRVYDASGEFLTENDDMPYRLWETDSGVYFQAVDEGGYYVEVLEYSDWAGSDDGPQGGSSYDYELYAYAFFLHEDEDDSSMDSALDGFYAAGSPEHTFSDYIYMALGEIDESGDVDYYALTPTGDSYRQWSFWPTDVQSLSPVMELYDDDGELLGQTTDPTFTTDIMWYYDAGITYRMEEERTYYLAVYDAEGNGGTGEGYFFPAMTVSYGTDATPEETEPNHPVEVAESLSLGESDDYAGYWYGAWWGVLEDEEDTSDNFSISSTSVGGLEGNYLDVHVATAMHGSLLDAEITVYQDDGTGELTELDSATVHPEDGYDDDPELWDVEIPGDGTLYVSITHEDELDEGALSHFYIAYVSIYSDPLH